MARESKASGNEAVPGFLSRQGIKEAEWQYALHSDFKVIMRPGWTWRARILACIVRQTRGFKRDLAVWQVGRETKKDQPTLLPLFPGGIAIALRKVAIEAFQEAGVNPDEETRKRFRIDRANLRRTLESLEVDDGVIVRARCNGDPKKLIADDLPLEQALARNRVVLLTSLPPKERQRVSNRLLIYLLPKPKAASLKALNRHDETFPQVVNNDYLPKDSASGIQLVFAFMRKQGLNGDAHFAARLAELPEVREAITMYEQQTSTAKEQLKAADKFMRDVVARVAAKTPPEGMLPDQPADTAQAPLFPAPAAPPEKASAAAQASNRLSASTGSDKGGAVPTSAPPEKLVSQPRRPASEEELKPIHDVMVQICGANVDSATVKKMWADCRCSVSDCTLKEVMDVVRMVGPRVAHKKGIDSPGKYLAKAVVTFFDGAGFQAWRVEQAAFDQAERGEPCAICTKPVEGAAIQGCHFECYEIAKTRSAS